PRAESDALGVRSERATDTPEREVAPGENLNEAEPPRPKRRSRRAKPKAPVPAPELPTTAVWVRVGPGKFVRVEEPSTAEAPPVVVEPGVAEEQSPAAEEERAPAAADEVPKSPDPGSPEFAAQEPAAESEGEFKGSANEPGAAQQRRFRAIRVDAG